MSVADSSEDLADFQRIKSLFDAVVDLPLNEREAALASLGADKASTSKVLAIIAESTVGGGTLGAAIAAVSGDLIANAEGAELQPGDSIGAWHLLSEIGRGGMGSVFLVERNDGHFEQRAALKLLAGIASERAMTHLARERQILADLTHPNIARLLDGGATPRGRPYLVLEYVDGLAIDKYCAQKSQAETVKLFIEVCNTVAFAHRQFVVHCDLKPSNILVTKDGRPILLDFGVSRLVGEAAKEQSAADQPENAPPLDSSATLTAAAYTPRYASPEQKSGGRVGVASDVYSLGVMLSELLGWSATDKPSHKRAAINTDFTAIIQRATALKPAERYLGADDFAADLTRALSHQPVAARPATAVYVSKKYVRRHWPWLLGVCAFVATVALFTWRTSVERDNALNAEKSALGVKNYMISVFQGADPEISGQRDLPVSTLLDAGRERLAGTLKDQPQTRAEITGILGSVYHSIGKREQASAMFEEAIRIERGNNRPAMLADLLSKHAYTVADMQDYPRAKPLAIEALRLREQTAPESLEMVSTLRVAGQNYSFLLDHVEALVLLKRAVALAEKLTGEASVETARTYLTLGQHLATMADGALPGTQYAERAHRIFEQKLGRSHYLSADALEVLGLGLAILGRYDEAVPIGREMSDIRAKIYGELSNQNGAGLHTYGIILRRAGRRIEAIAVTERCIAIQAGLDGRATLATNADLILLARSKWGAGAYLEAMVLIDEALTVLKKSLPLNQLGVQHAQFFKGQILRSLGRLEEAERVTLTVLTARELSPSTQKWPLAQSRLEMATVYRLQGNVEKAEKQLSLARETAFPPSPLRRAEMLSEQALLEGARGKTSVALKLLLATEELMEEVSPRHPDTWLQKLHRAELLAKMGQPQAARELARQISEHAKSSIEPTGAIAKRLARVMA